MTGYSVTAYISFERDAGENERAKILPDFGLTAAGSFRMTCRTPTIKTQSVATGYSFAVTIQGAGTWTATAKVGNAAVRKINP